MGAIGATESLSARLPPTEVPPQSLVIRSGLNFSTFALSFNLSKKKRLFFSPLHVAGSSRPVSLLPPEEEEHPGSIIVHSLVKQGVTQVFSRVSVHEGGPISIQKKLRNSLQLQGDVIKLSYAKDEYDDEYFLATFNGRKKKDTVPIAISLSPNAFSAVLDEDFGISSLKMWFSKRPGVIIVGEPPLDDLKNLLETLRFNNGGRMYPVKDIFFVSNAFEFDTMLKTAMEEANKQVPGPILMIFSQDMITSLK